MQLAKLGVVVCEVTVSHPIYRLQVMLSFASITHKQASITRIQRCFSRIDGSSFLIL